MQPVPHFSIGLHNRTPCLAVSDEIQDISLSETLVRIFSLVWDTVRTLYATSEQLVQQIIETRMKEALALIKPAFVPKCES